MKEETKTKTKAVKKKKEPVPTLEHLELLISDEYELKKSIPIRVYRYDDGVTVIRSIELNLYAQDVTDYGAYREFSEVLIDQLEDLETMVDEGEELGRALEIELSMLRRLLRKIQK